MRSGPVSCPPFEALAALDCSERLRPARMKVAPIRFAGQLRMGAVIRKQDRHDESRSVVAELAAAIIGPDSAPVIAVGETAINLTPIPVKDFAITHFGSHDKQALVAGILVMLAGFAALIGAAAAGVLAAVAGGAGDVLLRRFSVASSRAQVRLPAAAVRAPAVPAGTELRIPGLTPFFTPNASFYRVDTDLVLPQVAPESWTLRIDGMVGRELELSFAELLKMPLTETDITLVCVSNQVGGP